MKAIFKKTFIPILIDKVTAVFSMLKITLPNKIGPGLNAKGHGAFEITFKALVSSLLLTQIPVSVFAQAPSSVAGNSVYIAVTGGTYPFATYGYCLLLPSSSGNGYQTVGIYGVENSGGTYSYAGNGSVGDITLNDTVGGEILGTLSFESTTSGFYSVTNPTYNAYQNGNFQFFSGQVPNSIAGDTIECTIQNGVSPLATLGTFTFITAPTGYSYKIVGDKVHTTSSSGTYFYSKLNDTTALVQLSDRKLGTEYSYISVSAQNTASSFSMTGEFATRSSSAEAYQIGSFVWAPFLTVKGSYNGIFFESNGVSEISAGMLKGLNINQNGIYSGTVLLNGASHPITGTFGLNGQATSTFKASGYEGDVALTMALITSSNSASQITGTISGMAGGVPWEAGLLANMAAGTFTSSEYTMMLAPDTNNAPPFSSPGGDGYGLISCTGGIAKITGAMADGTSWSQTVPASQDGSVPLYANLYGGKGLLLGWINPDNNGATNVGLTWIHPVRNSGLYRGGFANVLLTNQVLISPWTNPPANLVLLTNISASDLIGGTNTLSNIPVTAELVGNVAKVTGQSLIGTINLKDGALKVTIGTGPSKITGYGAILLNNLTNSGGYFLTKTNALAVQLTP